MPELRKEREKEMSFTVLFYFVGFFVVPIAYRIYEGRKIEIGLLFCIGVLWPLIALASVFTVLIEI